MLYHERMLEDAPDYLGPYRRAVDSVGPGFPALLFGSRDMQRRRFDILGGSVRFDGRSIADLGSGHGDLLAWLDGQSSAFASYVGVEAIPEFHRLACERAETRSKARGDRRASFVCADFVADDELLARLVRERGVDTVVASGSLNTLDEVRALAVLDRAWRALDGVVGGVLAFNFLSGGDDWPRPQTELPRRDTRAWFAWALERTPRVVFCQHYLDAHDATLVMSRGSRRASC